MVLWTQIQKNLSKNNHIQEKRLTTPLDLIISHIQLITSSRNLKNLLDTTERVLCIRVIIFISHGCVLKIAQIWIISATFKRIDITTVCQFLKILQYESNTSETYLELSNDSEKNSLENKEFIKRPMNNFEYLISLWISNYLRESF